MIYSIVESAKANGLNTYQYLELLLTELPKHKEDKTLLFSTNCFPGHNGFKQNVLADPKNLNFSRNEY